MRMYYKFDDVWFFNENDIVRYLVLSVDDQYEIALREDSERKYEEYIVEKLLEDKEVKVYGKKFRSLGQVLHYFGFNPLKYVSWVLKNSKDKNYYSVYHIKRYINYLQNLDRRIYRTVERDEGRRDRNLTYKIPLGTKVIFNGDGVKDSKQGVKIPGI